jgi:hypothetical protein
VICVEIIFGISRVDLRVMQSVFVIVVMLFIRQFRCMTLACSFSIMDEESTALHCRVDDLERHLEYVSACFLESSFKLLWFILLTMSLN